MSTEQTKQEQATELKPVSQNNQLAIVGGNDAESFALTQRKAIMLSKSTLVPKNFQGNVPDCIIALEMAARMNASELMVMQNLYIVHGKPSWSSQFLISCFNTSGRFTPMKFTFVGAPGTDQWGCFATAKEKGSGEVLKGSTITVAMAKAEGWWDKTDSKGNLISKWRTMPEQMMMYRAAAFFVRVYAPEIANGMMTREEAEEVEYEIIQDIPAVSAAEEANQNENKQVFEEESPKPEEKKEPEENEMPDAFN